MIYDMCVFVYAGMQGFQMKMNAWGQVEGNYTLLSWQPLTPIHNNTDPLYFPADYALQPVGIFQTYHNASHPPGSAIPVHAHLGLLDEGVERNEKSRKRSRAVS